MSSSSFSALLRLFRAQAFLQARLEPELGSVHGLGLNESMLLLQLSRAPLKRLRRVDLAGRLNVSQSTVTRMADPLEKAGLVRREADPRDARVAYVALTEAGEIRVAEAETTLRRMAVDTFQDRWSEGEIQALADLLGRLTAALAGDVA